jgi:hypothetical protein
LQVIFPEFESSDIHLIEVSAWDHMQRIKNPANKFAATMSLFLAINGVDSSDRIKAVVARLKLSKNDLKKILFLFNIRSSLPAEEASQSLCMDFLDHADDVFGQKSAWLEIVQHYLSALSLQLKIDLNSQMKKISLIERDKSHLRFADLPISTHEMIKILGLQPGPEVGEALAALRSSYRNEEWFSKPEGEAWLRKSVRIYGL